MTTLSAPIPDDRTFATEHLRADLRQRSVRGGALTLAAQGGKFAFQMGSMVVLARLLAPTDFGLVAMVTAVTGSMTMCKDVGLSAATVQRERITAGQVSTLFWINTVLGIGLSCAAAGLGPVLAWVYGEPRLVWIAAALATTFLFSGAAVQHEALLKRQLRFRALATIDVTALGVAMAAGIVGAAMGMGYWSLVLSQVSLTASYAVLCWVCSGWLPGRPRRHTGVGSMLKFGGNLTGFGLVNYLCRNADNMLIGWYWGAAPLGIYTRAYGLLMLPIRQFNRPMGAVAVPGLTRLQEQPERFARFYCRTLYLIALVTMPLSAFLMVFAEPLVRVVLGEQWLEAADVFRFLAVAALLQPLLSSIGWLMTALGQGGKVLWYGIGNAVVIIGAFVCGLRFGPKGVALGYSIACLVLIMPAFWYATRGTAIRLGAIWDALQRPVAGVAVTGAACGTVAAALPTGTAPLVTIATGAAAGAAAYAGTIWVLGDLPFLRSVLRELRPAKDSAQTAAV